MTDDRTPPGPIDDMPDGDVMAAEYALGLLEGDERATAMRRVLAEPEFAAAVERWRLHFGTLFGASPEIAAPADGLARLERALTPAANDAAPSLRLWQGMAAGISLVAAALLLMLLVQPRPAQTPPPQVAVARQTILVTQIAPAKDGPPVAAVFDPASGDLRVAAATLVDAKHSAELWVIAADGVPHSLGVLAPGQATSVAIIGPNRARLAAGSMLAVTIEPVGGSPSGKPTGDVIAKGALTLV